MKQIKTAEDIYSAVDELVVQLKAAGQSRVAAILDHRMHKVAWTSRSELFEELQKILTKILETDSQNVPSLLREQIDRVLFTIGNFLQQ